MFHLRPKNEKGMLDDTAGGYLTILLRCEKLGDFINAAIDHLEDEGVWIVDIEDIVCVTNDVEAESRGAEFFEAWQRAAEDGNISELSLHRYLAHDA